MDPWPGTYIWLAFTSDLIVFDSGKGSKRNEVQQPVVSVT